MTLISVVVPVHRVQGFLRQCLDSVLDQGFDDLELIAVDDCSPDGCAAILAEYAARDARVRVLSLPENVGLGPARNAGLDAATGDYVWFLDSDDWLASGALPAVARRLRDVAPDVLIVDQVRTYWDGRSESSGLAALRNAPPIFSPQQRPRVLKILHTAWNKLIRRQLLLDLGLRFAPGWYEDVSFTFPVLCAARRISVLNRVCVHYRQRRVGAITRTVGDRHFDVFAHWERVFALLTAWGPPADELRTAVFRRMIWHYLIVLGDGDRVPVRSRRAFFERAHADVRRYQPADGYRPPRGAEGVKQRLLARGAWRTFSVLRAGVRLRKRLRPPADRLGRLARRVVRGLPTVAGRVWYAAQRRLPRDDRLAVYAAYWYGGYACNPAAIYEKAAELAPHVRGVWVVRPDGAGSVPPGVPSVAPGSLASYRALARATWLINNVNFPDFVVKRPGSVHVQTHHGTPVKAMGVEQLRHPAGAGRRDFPALLRRSDRWDVSLSGNPLSTEEWERAYPCRYQTWELGYPRNDELVRAGPAQAAAARAALGVSPDDRVLLYAPTVRDHHPGYVPPFDAEAVADALGAHGRVLMRRHPSDRAPWPGGDGPRVLDVTAHRRIAELYLAADVLVTDYSAAMFDYAVLDRPVLLYLPDWPVYRAIRGVTFDLPSHPPGLVVTTLEELVAALRSGGYAGRAATAARAAFRARFCPHDDGGAAERVVRWLFLNERPEKGATWPRPAPSESVTTVSVPSTARSS